MRGQVLGVDRRTGDGIVSGEDGRRYSFKPDDWAAKGEPAIGMEVDFEAHETRALALFPVPGTSAAPAPVASRPPAAERSDRNKYVAAALAFFLGVIGIHRFYLGRNGSAVLMIVISATVVGLLVTSLWAFIDMVRYLIMSDAEFDHRYARSYPR